MNTKQKIKILSVFSLFKDLKNTDIELFAKKTRTKIFPPKTLILNQSQPAEAVYFMYKGLVKIYIMNSDGLPIPIRTRGPNYVIGEINLFDDESTASIETIQETHTLYCSKETCLKLVMNNPQFAFNLLKMLSEKLRAANRQTDNYVTLPLLERTKSAIETLASHFPNNEIELSQEEIALVVGSSRARISEILNELKKQGIISLTRRKIRLLQLL